MGNPDPAGPRCDALVAATTTDEPNGRSNRSSSRWSNCDSAMSVRSTVGDT
jgi:hypothetical protein